MRYIPVENDINKALAFANSLDLNLILKFKNLTKNPIILTPLKQQKIYKMKDGKYMGLMNLGKKEIEKLINIS